MTEPNNPLPDRVSRLEHEMIEVRRDSTDGLNMARVLDRDVAKLEAQRRADVKLFHALRDTQIEDGKEMRELHTDMTEVRTEISGMRKGFGDLNVGMAQITAMLTIALDHPNEPTPD